MTCHVNDRLLSGSTCFDFGLIVCMYNGGRGGEERSFKQKICLHKCVPQEVNDKIRCLSGNANQPKAGAIILHPCTSALSHPTRSILLPEESMNLDLPSISALTASFQTTLFLTQKIVPARVGLLPPFWNLHKRTLSNTQVRLCQSGACP